MQKAFKQRYSNQWCHSADGEGHQAYCEKPENTILLEADSNY